MVVEPNPFETYANVKLDHHCRDRGINSKIFEVSQARWMTAGWIPSGKTHFPETKSEATCQEATTPPKGAATWSSNHPFSGAVAVSFREDIIPLKSPPNSGMAGSRLPGVVAVREGLLVDQVIQSKSPASLSVEPLKSPGSPPSLSPEKWWVSETAPLFF